MRQLKLQRKFMNPQTRSALKWTYWIEDDGKQIWQDWTNWDYVAVHIDFVRVRDFTTDVEYGEPRPFVRTKFRSYSDVGGQAEILATLDNVVVCTDGSVQLVDDMGIIRDTTEVLASCEAQSLVSEDDFVGVPV